MKLHDLKLFLQEHFTDGLVIIVGSGLSSAEGLPGMWELARHLERTVEPGLNVVDKALWTKIAPAISKSGLEAALFETPPSQSLEETIAAKTATLILEAERQVVADVFSHGRKLRFTRLLKHVLKPTTGIPVITTNYDCLVEVASEEAGLGVDTMFVGQFAAEFNEKESRLSFGRDVRLKGKNVLWRYRPRVNVYKPHGSLDWFYREDKPVRYGGELDMPRLVIMPGLNKFRNGYESPFDRHRERANQAIDNAGRFVIIGYGFNDNHLETHLKARIRSGTPTLLLTYALSDNAKTLAASHANFTALEHTMAGGISSTLATVNGIKIPFEGINLWDLGSFVSEVLEP